MKTTRRSLLTMLGLGAAAAALAPVKGVEAAPVVPDPMAAKHEALLAHVDRGYATFADLMEVRGAATITDDTPMLSANEVNAVMRGVWDQAYEKGLSDVSPDVYSSAECEFWCTEHLTANGAGHWHRIGDAIAQARADGYNQGRTVEEARQESRYWIAGDEEPTIRQPKYVAAGTVQRGEDDVVPNMAQIKESIGQDVDREWTRRFSLYNRGNWTFGEAVPYTSPEGTIYTRIPGRYLWGEG